MGPAIWSHGPWVMGGVGGRGGDRVGIGDGGVGVRGFLDIHGHPWRISLNSIGVPFGDEKGSGYPWTPMEIY